MQLWYVPVLEAGRVIAFLVVEQSDRFPCQAVSFGYTRLAAQFEEALLGSDKRDMAVLVAVFQAREQFLAFPDLEPDRLYSLNSFEVKKQQSNADVLDNTLDAVVMRLIPVVNASIKQGGDRLMTRKSKNRLLPPLFLRFYFCPQSDLYRRMWLWISISAIRKKINGVGRPHRSACYVSTNTI